MPTRSEDEERYKVYLDSNPSSRLTLYQVPRVIHLFYKD